MLFGDVKKSLSPGCVTSVLMNLCSLKTYTYLQEKECSKSVASFFAPFLLDQSIELIQNICCGPPQTMHEPSPALNKILASMGIPDLILSASSYVDICCLEE